MGNCGLYAPGYYGEFECIKGDCKHSCCIGWEIDIDERSLGRYSSLSGDIGDRIRASISHDGDAHFELVENRCPHLDECGLCRIITELGEGYLSDICRLHPRFFNDTAKGREVGLGMSCERASEIILKSDLYRDIKRIGECDYTEVGFDVTPFRERVYSLLSRREKSFAERVSEIEKSFSVSPELLTDEEWREVLSSLEYLDRSSGEWFECYSSALHDPRYDLQLERALAYFVYRHASGAKNEHEFRTGLGVSLFLVRLLASLALSEDIRSEEDFVYLARAISEEIEYSTDNTDAIRTEFEFLI